MATVEELELKVTADTASAERKMTGLAGTVDKQSKKMGDSLTNAGKKMTLGVTLPIAGAAIGMFNLASDADEAASQVSTVFGKFADDIAKEAENVNDAFSTSEFNAYAATIGNIGQGLGFTQGEAADLSQEVLTLAQDFASFNNLPIDDTVNAVSKALTGETEAMKSLGVVINQADIKNKALAEGLWDGESALDAQAKATATLMLVTERGGSAIGDFDRTSEGAANSSKILSANMKDAAAAMGEKLLPIGTKIIGWLTTMVDKFTGLSDKSQTIILVIAGIAAAIGPLLLIGGALASAFTAISGAFAAVSASAIVVSVGLGPLILGVGALIAVGVLLYKNWDTISAFAKKIWSGIKKRIMGPINAIKAGWEKFWAVAQPVGELAMKAISKYVTTYFKIIKGVIMVFITLVQVAWETFWAVISGAASIAMDLVGDDVVAAVGIITDTIGDVIDTVGGIWDTFTENLSEAWGVVWDNIGGPMETALRAVTGVLKFMLNGILGALEYSLNGIIDGLNGAIRLFNKLPGPDFDQVGHVAIPRLAEGGMTNNSGPVKVGERGPEILHLPTGASVTPGGAAGPLIGTLNMNGTNDPQANAKAIGWELIKKGGGN